MKSQSPKLEQIVLLSSTVLINCFRVLISTFVLFHNIRFCIVFVFFFGIQSVFNAENCYQPFGCFPNSDEFFHSLYRPVNLYPQDPFTVNTKFFLYAKWIRPYTQQQFGVDRCGGFESSALSSDIFYKPCLISTDDLVDRDKLDDKLKKLVSLRNLTSKQHQGNQRSKSWTAFVVHGFLDDINETDWMSRIKDALLTNRFERTYDLVVLVDWKGGNGLPYIQATANTRLVGVEIAYLIKQLNKYLGIHINQTQIIGHSLGSHIAGYAGKKFFKPKLGRITALDPAGPNFEGMPISVRVDRSDAQFVDVIHTNGKPLYLSGYGMQDPVGHVDFYPNGGLDQSGCAISSLPTVFDQLFRNSGSITNLGKLSRTVSQFVVCSHIRAIDYFLESIPSFPLNHSPCKFRSMLCTSWTDYLEANCISNTTKQQPAHAYMGFSSYQWADRMVDIDRMNFPFRYYLTTNTESPFCKD